MFAEEKKYLMPLVDYKPIYEIPEINIAKSSVNSYEFLMEGLL
jgi:hypothetical protein